MKRILIVEDDVKLNNGIKLALRSEYICIQVFSLQSAKEALEQEKIDLILLDINLPDGNGMDFLAEVRKDNHVPIIILTANNMETDVVAGLELGADDYLTKPFSLMILRARVRVQLRNDKVKSDETGIFENEIFYFDFCKMEFYKGKECIVLSKTEQKLLRCLIQNKGRNVSRNLLIDEVWQGETEFVDEHALTVAVNRLRGKLGDDSGNPSFIKTVYGIGYTWTTL